MLSLSRNSTGSHRPDTTSSIVSFQDNITFFTAKNDDIVDLRADSGISELEDDVSVASEISDAVSQMPEGWPNISCLLASHSWDFTSSVHPSANKAMSHLELLQRSLIEWQRLDLMAGSSASSKKDASTTRILTTSSSSDSKTSRATFQPDTNLRIDGLGQIPDKSVLFLGADDVIEEVITLLAKLEKDRHETLKSLHDERERVSTLGSKIDDLAGDRMSRISDAVQKEHEACAADISELKWFIKYRSRTETRTKEKVDTADLLNSRLKEEIEHVKLHIPLVEEKLDLESEAMARISLAQQDTNNELDLTMSRCAKVKVKSNEAFEKAKVERIEIKKDLDQVKSLLNKVNNDLYEAEKLHSEYIKKCTNHKETIRHHHIDLPLQTQRNISASEKKIMQAAKVKELENVLSSAKNENDLLNNQKEKLSKEFSDQQEAFAKEEQELKAMMLQREETLQSLSKKRKEHEFERDETKKKKVPTATLR